MCLSSRRDRAARTLGIPALAIPDDKRHEILGAVVTAARGIHIATKQVTITGESTTHRQGRSTEPASGSGCTCSSAIFFRVGQRRLRVAANPNCEPGDLLVGERDSQALCEDSTRHARSIYSSARGGKPAPMLFALPYGNASKIPLGRSWQPSRVMASIGRGKGG
jgi:hypothetical protein